MVFPINEALPIACTLTPDAMAVRSSEITQLFRHALAVQELADGYTLVFPAGGSWEQSLLAFIEAERACCPFFTFALTFPSPHAEVWLSLRGAAGAKEILSIEVASRNAEKENTDER